MKKLMRLASFLIIAGVLLSFAFISKEVKVPEALLVTEPVEVLFPEIKKELKTTTATPPFIGRSYIGFKEAVGFRESQGDYFSVNTLGYLGKYQFGIGTLQLMGVNNGRKFLKNPALQEEVFKTNLARNKWILRREIKRFNGKRIKGGQVTESGMLAAAHLAGPGNVMKYLHSYGRYDVQDAYGTKISKYLYKFGGYDVSTITAERNPQVTKI